MKNICCKSKVKRSLRIKKYSNKARENDMSFSMKKIDCASFNYMDNQNSIAGKQISSFSCRADVIFKKILSEFRRFYISDFTEVTGIKDLGKISDKEVEETLLKYTDEVFSSEKLVIGI
jgi:hypothetical protein